MTTEIKLSDIEKCAKEVFDKLEKKRKLVAIIKGKRIYKLRRMYRVYRL